MKKISILVAAFAMIAFAGCKKEENGLTPDANGMVTINLTGEKYTDSSKQTLDGFLNRIMFDNGENLYFNGATANIVCVDENDPMGPAPTNSFWCRISVPENAIAENNVILYPASAYTPGTAADYSDWTVSVYDDVEMIPATEDEYIIDGSSFQAWPMAAYGTSSRGHFYMKNCVALLAPSVKYGYSFLYELRNTFGRTIDRNNLPTLTVLGAVITSSDAVLTGNGHISGLDTEAPTLVMNTDADAGYTITGRLATPREVPAGNGQEVIVGNIPAAPMALGTHIQMDLYFTITFPATTEGGVPTVFYGKYNSLPVELAGGQLSVLRSQRTTLCVNLFDGSEEHLSHVTIQNTPFVF